MRVWIAIVASIFLSATAIAQEIYEEGKDYKRLSTPVRTANPNKIELVEAFSYTCAHCFSFEPLVKEYKKKLPDDVLFVRAHVSWDSMTENLARALYTAKALKVEDEIHEALFRGLHIERKVIRTPEEIQAVFETVGVDGEKFEKAFNSFGINSQTKQSNAKIRGYKIDSTPQLVVNGEYVISANRDIDHKEMLKIADFLITKIRKSKS